MVFETADDVRQALRVIEVHVMRAWEMEERRARARLLSGLVRSSVKALLHSPS